jgi:acyl-CoA oxidase
LRDADLLSAALAWGVVADPRLGMNFVTHTLLCSGSVVRLAADREAADRALQMLDGADVRGSYLITEAGRANSHLATRTRAVFDQQRGDFVLDTPDPAAAKWGGVPAEGPRSAVVLARTEIAGEEVGVFPFLVELADAQGLRPGVELSPPSEVTALPLTYRTVSFHGARVPSALWLCGNARLDDGVLTDPLGSAAARLQQSLSVGQGLWGALPTAAAAVARQSALLAIRYARERPTQALLAPGAPLLSYRSQQRALIGAMADAYALSCAAAHARDLLQALLDTPTSTSDQPGAAMGFAPWTAVSRDLSAYKAHAVRAAERIVAECQRRCGYAGLVDANRLSGYRGFQHAFDPAGGDSQLILYDLGQALVREAQEAEDGGAGAEAFHPTPPYDATDPHWWPAVLRAHESALARRLATALSTRRHLDAFEAWNPLLDLAGELGEIHAARLAAEDVPWVQERFLGDLSSPLRSVLDDLAALSVLRAVQRWSGPLLAQGTLGPHDLDAVPLEIDRLCERILPHLSLLDELFSFPDDIVCSGLGERGLKSDEFTTQGAHR